MDNLSPHFCNGVEGAEAALARLEAGGKLPAGLTKETLENAMNIAIETATTSETQAARLNVIVKALDHLRMVQ